MYLELHCTLVHLQDVLAYKVQPTAALRGTARRLLQVHPLRCANSLQLAAAVIASEGLPASLNIVTLDERLASAARREGFMVQAVEPVG